MLSVAASVSEEGTQLPGRYYPTPPHPPASGDDAMLSVAASVSEEGTQLPGPPHPTPPHLGTMPCWVWPQVCQRKERSCQDVIIPPHPTPRHLGTMPCWVWPQVCQRKERSCQDVIIPPHPTPPPPASGDDAMLTVAAIVTRMLVSESCGWWLGNSLFLVAKSSCFGCGIAFFLLRNRLFLVAESVIFGCGSAFFWLRKRVWFWLRNRRNLVAEASKYGFGIGIYSLLWHHTSTCPGLSNVHISSAGPGSPQPTSCFRDFPLNKSRPKLRLGHALDVWHWHLTFQASRWCLEYFIIPHSSGQLVKLEV